MSDSLNAIQNFIKEKLGIDCDISQLQNTSLLDSGYVDSFGLLELIGGIESHFSIRLDLSGIDPHELTTFSGLSAVVLGKLKGNLDQFEFENVDSPKLAGVAIEQMDPARSTWSDLAELFERMYMEFAQHGLRIGLAPEGAQAWLRAMNSSLGSSNLIFAAFDRGVMTGFVHAVRKILPTYLGGGVVGEIVHLYVKPDFRRKGVGQQLAEHALGRLADGGVHSIEIKVLSENGPAIAFWQTFGFSSELQQMRMMLPVRAS